jgi:hypothetical protein
MLETTEQRAGELTVGLRYTLSGETQAEARVAQDLSRLATGIDSELGDDLRALLLAGPLARAEGGIVERAGEPYAADPGYELIALFRRPERFVQRLRAMSAAYEHMLGARVAIAAFAPAELANVTATRFWYTAGRGWLIPLLGDPALALAIPRREPRELHWQEAARALCQGLLPLALHELRPQRADHMRATVDVIQRAVLGCGDGLLLRRGQYADTLAARAAALDAAQASAALRAAYRSAIEWSSRPDRFGVAHDELPALEESTRRTLAQALLAADAERLGSARDLLGLASLDESLFEPPSPRGGGMRRVLRALPHRSAPADWHEQPLEILVRASMLLALSPQVPPHRRRAAELLGLRASASDSELATALRDLAHDALRQTRFEHPFPARDFATDS